MTTETSIFDAFATTLAIFATAQSVPVAWPGVAFTAPGSGQWIEMAWFPNETLNMGFGNDGPSNHRGFGQLSCCCRPGVGIEAVMTLAGNAIAAFAKGTALGPARVERKPWASTVLVAGDRISIPVTVPYLGAVTVTN